MSKASDGSHTKYKCDRCGQSTKYIWRNLPNLPIEGAKPWQKLICGKCIQKLDDRRYPHNAFD